MTFFQVKKEILFIGKKKDIENTIRFSHIFII